MNKPKSEIAQWLERVHCRDKTGGSKPPSLDFFPMADYDRFAKCNNRHF